MGTPVNIIVGSHVWLEDPGEAWVDGVVTEIKGGGDATIATTSGKTVVASLGSIYPKDTEAPPSGVDDMTKLAYLHEPGVLHNLSCRYGLNEIYTYTGNILIAVNPFQRLPHLYDVHMMEQYKGASFGELSPHLFAIADACYRALINDQGSQAILVSGESGAGKTETTKMLMRYLAFMGGRSGTEGRTVEQQVLESNPVLEAFGNAKTVKNNNSSRFGKFVEIQFDKYGKISGAAVRTYLLERSRVCQVSDPERNYHCFYMLCSAPPEDVKRFKVGDPRSFHYLNQTNCYEVANVDDAREYIETRNAMDIVGIDQEEQDAIFRVVAAILHLGNINFSKGQEIDSSKLRDDKSVYHLKTVAELLMCDEKALEASLCQRVIVTPDGNITKPLDPDSSIMTALVLGLPLTRRAPLLVDAVRLAENRAQHRRVFGRRRRRGRHSRRRTRRGRGNRRRTRRGRRNRTRLAASSVIQASGSALAPPAPPTPPATPVRLPSPTPGSFSLAAGPRDVPAPYAFHQAGQTTVNFNTNSAAAPAAVPAVLPAATPVEIAPATPPPVWERRVRRRTTTAEDNRPGLRPGSWTATFQRLSHGVLSNRFDDEAGPSGVGGYSPN